VLLTKYYLGGQDKNNEMYGTCGTYGERVGGYRVFGGGRLEGKRPLGRPRSRWEVNGVRPGLVWLRIRTLVKAVMNLRVP
jgi:hypothetical protein